jgi:2-aminoethylphosphonate-pyruvate transaminase
MCSMTQHQRLLTPGPLTTTERVKRAMLRDWGSRNADFIALNRAVLDRLVELIGGGDEHVAVPMQGSGSFAVEAMLGTLVPRDGKLLVMVNGAYGARMVEMARYMGRAVVAIEDPEDRPGDTRRLEETLAADPAIGHVAAVYCETTSGILNPIDEIARIAARHGRALLIDAMSAFGALPLDAARIRFEAVTASANKCLEGVPGIGFVLARKDALAAAEGNAHSLTLDLAAQHAAMVRTGQWRFTPPTHVLAAFHEALVQHEEEGGVEGRGRRYRENCRVLVDGMRRLGFQPLLEEALQAPIIVTFRMPRDPAFDFLQFYDRLAAKGFVIYPGKLTVAPSFRIGCIGALGADDMHAAMAAIEATLGELGVANGRP